MYIKFYTIWFVNLAHQFFYARVYVIIIIYLSKFNNNIRQKDKLATSVFKG